MKKIAIVLTLAVAFSYLTVSSVQADPLQTGQAAAYMNNSVKAAPLPIWKITQDGTADCVTWVDATNKRFAIYDPGTPSDETDDVVLDKETGLVWERVHEKITMDWVTAIRNSFQLILGGRAGWRLPTVEEVASLMDVTTVDHLPSGHPFVYEGGNPGVIWTSTTDHLYVGRAWVVNFSYVLPPSISAGLKTNYAYMWAVRGGQGFDAY
jgi:hypothetical protein